MSTFKSSLLITLLDTIDCYTIKIVKPTTLEDLKQKILVYIQCIDCLENTTVDKLRLTFENVLLISTNYKYLQHMDKINVQVCDKLAKFPFYTNNNLVNNIEEKEMKIKIDNSSFNTFINTTNIKDSSFKTNQNYMDIDSINIDTMNIDTIECSSSSSSFSFSNNQNTSSSFVYNFSKLKRKYQMMQEIDNFPTKRIDIK